MTASQAVWLVLVLAAVGANLPFVNERLFVIGPRRAPKKGVGWRLLELLVYAAAVIAGGMALESSLGQGQRQGWQFYAVIACIFLTLAFPGFVWRYLRRRRG
jgi:hypothetical protein